MSLYGNPDKAQNSRIGLSKKITDTEATSVDAELEYLESAVVLRVLSNGGAFVPPTTDLGIIGSMWNDGGVLKISSAT